MDLYVLSFFFALATRSAFAAPLDDSRDAKILKYEFTNDGSGPYYFEYQQSDGQSRTEQAEVTNSETIVRGSYSFAGSDGVVYTVTYTADKDGFHPEGDHIKVPPYTPWPTNRQLADDDDDGHYRPEQDVQRDEIVPNAYLPSSTTEKAPQVTEGYASVTIDKLNPFSAGGFRSATVSNAYIPSTVGPKIGSVTVSPLNHVGAGSSPVPDTINGGAGGLFEVIQNNHSNGGVFRDESKQNKSGAFEVIQNNHSDGGVFQNE